MKIKKVSDYQVVSFVYKNQELRDAHVDMMEKEGWVSTGQIKRLKEGIDPLAVAELKDEHYEPFAKFIKGELE